MSKGPAPRMIAVVMPRSLCSKAPTRAVSHIRRMSADRTTKGGAAAGGGSAQASRDKARDRTRRVIRAVSSALPVPHFTAVFQHAWSSAPIRTNPTT